MPHLILQYTANVDPPDVRRLFGDLHRILADLVGLDVRAFKSRAIRYEDFCVGDGSPTNAFVHLDLRLLGGRSDEHKRALSDAALALLARNFAVGELDLQITVDLLDLDSNTYRKLNAKGGTS